MIFLLACSMHFVRRRLWAISNESQRTRPNRRRTNASRSLELHIVLNLGRCPSDFFACGNNGTRS